jgi:5-methylcytosine-specific restriction protein A
MDGAAPQHMQDSDVAARQRRPDDHLLGTRQWQDLRAAILERDHYTCQINGPRCTTVATAVDHIIARSLGGAFFDEANLRAACVACNSREAVHLVNAVRAGRSLGARSRPW